MKGCFQAYYFQQLVSLRQRIMGNESTSNVVIYKINGIT